MLMILLASEFIRMGLGRGLGRILAGAYSPPPTDVTVVAAPTAAAPGVAPPAAATVTVVP